MAQFSNIIEGWGNYLSGSEKELAKERLKECVKCFDDNGKPNLIDGTIEKLMPDFSITEAQGKKCKQCGCPASTFSRSKSYKCPLNKW